ncbi:MAG: transcription termination factor NusA [Desulfatiglans sp.]|jgi:N utilization substance protein A|nr:transcription termination factor NusA [Thermodesulfobacteriota bacterium]MEE4351321.1 transcription termination factor NusA [Desulfatiglans sp.]
MPSDLAKMIEQVSREKGVDQQVLVKALEEAVQTAARKKYGQDYDLEVNFNEELGEIEVFEFKEVAENVTSEYLQISVEEAHAMDPEAEVGDSLGIKMDTDDFGRIAAQSAKQVIMQRLKEAERDIVFDDFKDRQGEIINGIVQRFDRGAIVVNLGRADGELPVREQVPNETYRQGDRIRAYILEVKQFGRGPQIILSRTHPNFVSALFESEVPEISEGIVQIMQVAREAGARTKIAVKSKDPDVDPIGACVGMKGRRVQAVVQELRGEKIDIVTWDPDAAKLVCNALAPADITRVVVDEGKHSMEVVVPDDQLSLAIGKRGQNVRLASRLTGWKLDVTNENDYNQALKKGYSSLLALEGIGEKMASDFYDRDFRSAEDIAGAAVSDLVAIEGITDELAEKLIEEAVEWVKHIEISGETSQEPEDDRKAPSDEKVEGVEAGDDKAEVPLESPEDEIPVSETASAVDDDTDEDEDLSNEDVKDKDVTNEQE